MPTPVDTIVATASTSSTGIQSARNSGPPKVSKPSREMAANAAAFTPVDIRPVTEVGAP